MRVLDVTGRDVPWSFQGYAVRADDRTPRSNLHLRARALIREVFACDQSYEEVPVPGSKMRLDFVVPSRRVVVEVQGEQHYKPSSYHHKNLQGFGRAVGRDRQKVEWCLQNNLNLIELPYDESDDEWRRRLLEC